MSRMGKIRQKIIDRSYYLSSHAEDEMLDDDLERRDIEYAIFNGRIQKTYTEDFRGTRHCIEGTIRDGRKIHIICRFKEDKNLIIITTYALPEDI